MDSNESGFAPLVLSSFKATVRSSNISRSSSDLIGFSESRMSVGNSFSVELES